ncbi:hypothetical protein [Nocardiopsis tropica]|jgi:hypothetical protein|uniref:Uncharacterized protein n=1 Tax=Nocardiopsis tropica TaxID=109330 RepID=A0ABU7KM10_9ACTN|nr:hypothetical protein [Nocardiopsis umidischolae]MEE2050167.1 hypothetical protein [Nocardiopsis umidischolae]
MSKTVGIVIASVAVFVAGTFGAGWLLGALAADGGLGPVVLVVLLVVVLGLALGGSEKKRRYGDGGGPEDFPDSGD